MHSLDDLHDALCTRGERPTWTVIGEELALVVHSGNGGRLVVRWDAAAGRVWLCQQTHTTLLDSTQFSVVARLVDDMDLGLTLDRNGANIAFRVWIELDADGALDYARFLTFALACRRQSERCLAALQASYHPVHGFVAAA